MSKPKRVLDTAGAGAAGIGRAIMQAFAAAGAKVHVCDLDSAALADLCAQVPGVTSMVCDIGDRAAVERMVAEAADSLGGIDVLTNNADISWPTASVEQLDPDAWEAVLRINLTGTFNVTRHAIPHLKRACSESRASVVLVMSSLAGRFGYPNRNPFDNYGEEYDRAADKYFRSSRRPTMDETPSRPARPSLPSCSPRSPLSPALPARRMRRVTRPCASWSASHPAGRSTSWRACSPTR